MTKNIPAALAALKEIIHMTEEHCIKVYGYSSKANTMPWVIKAKETIDMIQSHAEAQTGEDVVTADGFKLQSAEFHIYTGWKVNVVFGLKNSRAEAPTLKAAIDTASRDLLKTDGRG